MIQPMEPRFEVIFLEEVVIFLENVDQKTRTKILYNIDRTRYINDPKLFKKITSNIWEFRTLYQRKQYRVLAFWDKSNDLETLVITTHGFVKKTGRLEKKQIEKAENVRKKYFEE